MLTNEQSGHEIEEKDHEEGLDHLDRVKEHFEKHEYPQHLHDILDGIKSEMEDDYKEKSPDEKDEKDMSDRELIEKHVADLNGSKKEKE